MFPEIGNLGLVLPAELSKWTTDKVRKGVYCVCACACACACGGERSGSFVVSTSLVILLYPPLEGVTVLPEVIVSSASVNEDNKVAVKLSNGDEVSVVTDCVSEYD